jgi:hypothetical protein
VSGGLIELTDLTAPVFPDAVQSFLDEIALAATALDLFPQSLMDAAAADTSLADFGDTWFLAPLETLCRALREEAGLSPLGVTLIWAQLVGFLKSRLRVERLIADHPEIEDVEVRQPIIIAGLPRTGTTHLHNMLAADPGLRHLPYWESLEPVPADLDGSADPGPRRARAQQGLELVNGAMPHFAAMHEMTVDHAHEEIQLLALSFSTMFFETLAPMPSYRDWLLSTDQTPAYAYLRRVLQVLQWLRRGTRWVLKSPQHLAEFPALRTTFPDATFVVTHRDPVAVTISMATMAAYTARLQLADVDAVRIGRYWAGRVEDLLRACTIDRPLLPRERSIDVLFNDFMCDEQRVIERIYRVAEQPLTPQAIARMHEFRETHPRGRHGRINYCASAVGIDIDERRAALRFYVNRFGVEDDPAT